MRRTNRSTLDWALILLLTVVGGSLSAQRLEDLADRLAREASTFADEAYRGFSNRSLGTRADVESLYQVQQYSASVELFRRMVTDRRPIGELQDSQNLLNNRLRELERYSFTRSRYNQMQRLLDDISRTLSNSSSGSSRWGDDRDRTDIGRRDIDRRRDDRSTEITHGTLRWRGRIDQQVRIELQGGTTTVVNVLGTPPSEIQTNLTGSLPARDMVVTLNKIQGRGSITIWQQPAINNNYTAVIEINDPDRSSAVYEFEMRW